MGVGTGAAARAHVRQRPRAAVTAEVTRLEALLAAMLDERAEQEHELASALLAVEAAGHVLADRLGRRADPEDAELAVAVESEASRLRHLVSGPPDEPGDTFSVLHALRPVVAAHRAAGQRIALGVSPAVLVVGRPHALVAVVGHLLTNAARHAPGALVTLGTDPARLPGTVRLLVTDDGPGFPAAAFTHAAERGWRGAATRAPGSGLGLFVSSRLMEREGGSLTLLRPAPGTTGATVALDLREGRADTLSPRDLLADVS